MLEPGTEISLLGWRGRYRFDRYTDDGKAVTCWGPINNNRARWRTFYLEQISKVHKDKEEHPK